MGKTKMLINSKSDGVDVAVSQNGKPRVIYYNTHNIKSHDYVNSKCSALFGIDIIIVYLEVQLLFCPN